jgi:hypothetical protein
MDLWMLVKTPQKVKKVEARTPARGSKRAVPRASKTKTWQA